MGQAAARSSQTTETTGPALVGRIRLDKRRDGQNNAWWNWGSLWEWHGGWQIGMAKKWQKHGKKMANPRVFAIFLLFLQFGGLQRFAIFLPFQNFGCFGCQTVRHSFAILDFEDESTPQGMPGRVFALCGRLVLGIPGSRATA